MSREIKFRAWTGKEMYYQDNQYLASFVRRAVPKIIQAVDAKNWGTQTHESYLPNGGNISEYLEQFTGLRDKNGTEIYEGDLISDGLFVRAVTFGAGVFLAGEDNLYDYTNDETYRVIGNVHENPELLIEAKS
jgi:uncharacterized phage protein (TIGR01671 family)